MCDTIHVPLPYLAIFGLLAAIAASCPAAAARGRGHRADSQHLYSPPGHPLETFAVPQAPTQLPCCPHCCFPLGERLPYKLSPVMELGPKGTFQKAARGCLPLLLICSPGFCRQSSLLSCRNLSAIQDREICCYSISCKEKDNIGEYGWLLRGAQGAQAAPQVQDGVTARWRSYECPLAFTDITLQWLIQHSKSRRS